MQVMWLVAEAEALLRNTTRFDLGLALDLSRMQSVAYCHFPNVAAWNCTRCGSRTAAHLMCAVALGTALSMSPAQCRVPMLPCQEKFPCQLHFTRMVRLHLMQPHALSPPFQTAIPAIVTSKAQSCILC